MAKISKDADELRPYFPRLFDLCDGDITVDRVRLLGHCLPNHGEQSPLGIELAAFIISAETGTILLETLLMKHKRLPPPEEKK